MKNALTPINILYISAEADPLVKIGGLGDVAGTLPIAINRISTQNQLNIEVRVAIPYHNIIRENGLPISSIGSFQLKTINGLEEVSVFQYLSHGIIFYLLDGKPIQVSPVPYSDDNRANTAKYVFFSLAALHLPTFLNWPLHILQANDWHTALSVYAVKKMAEHTNEGVKCILSIHNLPFMGNSLDEIEMDYGITEYSHPYLPGWARKLPLPMGMAAADLIIPVSPGYAKEIESPDYGCGLENLVIHRKDHIVGILNGIDEAVWNPETDNAIPFRYNSDSQGLKEKNKTALQEKLQLKIDPKIPLLAAISRLDYQKGIDLIVDGLFKLSMQDKWQCVLLGTGDPYLEMRLRNLQNDRPDQVRCIFDFNQDLAHHIYAGADIFLMPSRYEPCGISQMISQRYGTIPIARATGGLIDTIVDTKDQKPGTGYLFDEINATVFASRMTRAISNFHDKPLWRSMIQNAMTQNFSWDGSAQKYIDEYQHLIFEHNFFEEDK